MKYDLVIFDLDGTILDTVEDLGNAVNYALAQKTFKPLSLKEYKALVGNGVRNLVTNAIPEIFRLENMVNTCLDYFMDYYKEHIDDCTKPYKGIQKLLEELSKNGVRIAIASNKFQEGVTRLVTRFFPDIKFVGIYGNKEGFPVKPDSALVDRIIADAYPEGTQTPPSDRIVVVGDGDSDMKLAVESGIPSIAVTWGYRSRAELNKAGATHIVDSVRELKKLLK